MALLVESRLVSPSFLSSSYPSSIPESRVLKEPAFFLEMSRKVVLPPAGVAAQLRLESLVIRVQIHVISQPLYVGILVPTYFVLECDILCLAMALVVRVLKPQVSHINGCLLVCLNLMFLSDFKL